MRGAGRGGQALRSPCKDGGSNGGEAVGRKEEEVERLRKPLALGPRGDTAARASSGPFPERAGVASRQGEVSRRKLEVRKGPQRGQIGWGGCSYEHRFMKVGGIGVAGL